MALKSRSRRVT